MPERSLRRLDVLADPKAVSLITARGGCLYVYADASGQKRVRTEAPTDPSIHFRQIEADGFRLYVQEGIKHPDLWSVTYRHIPYHHLDVAWDGHPAHPRMARAGCMMSGHDWWTDPDSMETVPVLLCRRCGKRRDLAEVLVTRYGLIRGLPALRGLQRVRDR